MLFSRLAVCFLFLFTSLYSAEQSLDVAYSNYIQGLNANTVKERNEHLNRALTLYKQAESTSGLTDDQGRLYYNIGNSYFQLGAYPEAILYYRKAHRLIPRDSRVKNNLSMAETELNIPHAQLHAFFSWHESWILWIILGFLAFFFSSLYIWQKSDKVKYTAYLLWSCWSLLLVSLIVDSYLSPIQAVAMQSSLLYRKPSIESTPIDNMPVAAGTSLTISESDPKEPWVKVYTADDRMGFLPIRDIRLIE
jgi:tetratricopeptide (TPR) repeat protein